MKETEVKLDDEGFEEIKSDDRPPKGGAGQNASGLGGEGSGDGGAGSGLGSGVGAGMNRPDLRVVQADRDKNGNVVYKNVGGMWKSVSKNGNDFYTLKIGELKLLVFPNDRK